ncbi:uncharacterized protein L203_102859 [Cryptococcus depauperatus CBS 7841]|uniref:DNA 3'-5' helicase n=1 Tax=Cryptococcus depauperatus CBS 7841 TaxID=1295531 RepID=A0AAJ8M137_9TREE
MESDQEQPLWTRIDTKKGEEMLLLGSPEHHKEENEIYNNGCRPYFNLDAYRFTPNTLARSAARGSTRAANASVMSRVRQQPFIRTTRLQTIRSARKRNSSHGVNANVNKLQRYDSEDYGDEIWEDDDFVQAANQSLQHETMVHDIEDCGSAATAQAIRETEYISEDAVSAKHGEALVPTSRLPIGQRKLFEFSVFNEVQSKVFDSVYQGDENIVVSAPTGSGKTTIFELAFLRSLTYRTPDESVKPLAIYIAPTKALCNEKTKDWQERMGQALTDVICVEITGDWPNSSTVYNTIRTADLVVTTPEKFDSMTRKSKNMEQMSRRLRLIMIDEVHILRESRGATLEVVISRMKGLSKGIRFVALSATVPNIDDIARWLGPSRIDYEQLSRRLLTQEKLVKGRNRQLAVEGSPMALVYKFGEEFRPVPLSRETYGIDGCGNDWTLSSKLDRELFPILLRHAAGQPVLVFCPTRKSCQATAEFIFNQYEKARARGLKLPWHHPPGRRLDLQDKKLAELSTCGIAIHHAGLDYGDRRAIEDAYRDGKLHMIASTSTLAVGVNLPAHTVIIKGVMAWQGPGVGFKEYSDIDIQQMVGRAGRPQYDRSGVVVVMCERTKVRKYQSMLNSQTILESCLHENLTEHLNSEIGQGTITSVDSAQDWLRNSFFYIRIQQNPRYYALPAAKDKPTDDSWREWLDRYVEESLMSLERDGFIERSNDDSLIPTETGRIMSGNMISYSTMCSIKEMLPKATLQDLLEILAGAAEFQDLRIRQGEFGFLNQLRDNQEIRFPLHENVFLLLQVTFGNIILDERVKKTDFSSPIQTLMAVYNHAPRISKAMVQFALHHEYGIAACSALELYRVVIGKAWEDSPTIFRQIANIGPKSIKVLGQNGVASFEQFLDVKPERIQLWLNRGPDFIKAIYNQVDKMPQFYVRIEEESRDHDGSFNVLNLRVHIQPKNNFMATESKRKCGGFITHYNLSALFLRQNGLFIGYRRMELKKLKNEGTSFLLAVSLDKRCDKVIAVVAVDEVAGCVTVVEYDTHLGDAIYSGVMNDQEDGRLSPFSRRILFQQPTSESEEELLPNGNLPCHHSCKDRQSCNHGCCKIGVSLKKRTRSARKGKGNIKTAFDRMREFQKSMEDVEGQLKHKDKLATLHKNRDASTLTEKSASVCVLHYRRPMVVHESSEDLSESRRRPESLTPSNRLQKGKSSESLMSTTPEPLFLPNFEEAEMFHLDFSDQESQKRPPPEPSLGSKCRYFDKNKHKAIDRLDTMKIHRQSASQSPFLLTANLESPVISANRRNEIPAQKIELPSGMFTSDEDYETVQESPEPPKHLKTPSPPSQAWSSENMLQHNMFEESPRTSPSSKRKFDCRANYNFDADRIFGLPYYERSDLQDRMSADYEEEDISQTFTSIWSHWTQPLVVGGFGRPANKKPRLSEKKLTAHDHSIYTNNPKNNSDTDDIAANDESFDGSHDEKTVADNSQPQGFQNELEEFEQWYMKVDV